MCTIYPIAQRGRFRRGDGKALPHKFSQGRVEQWSLQEISLGQRILQHIPQSLERI